ncbi:MAG: DNA-3-methyladenine glycosylase I [Phycisphaerae bacterium]
MGRNSRCKWADSSDLMVTYHDTEWGVPCRDDLALFGKLVLDGAQAGLSWSTILNKRQGYLAAFDNFDPVKMARYNQRKVDRLLKDPGIVRNKLKIASAIKNAKAYLRVQEESGSFGDLLWGFVNGEPIINHWKTPEQVPATSAESDAMSAELKARGFSFVGSTICYAFMQAVGMVNDHTTDCFRHAALG